MVLTVSMNSMWCFIHRDLYSITHSRNLLSRFIDLHYIWKSLVDVDDDDGRQNIVCGWSLSLSLWMCLCVLRIGGKFWFCGELNENYKSFESARTVDDGLFLLDIRCCGMRPMNGWINFRNVCVRFKEFTSPPSFYDALTLFELFVGMGRRSKRKLFKVMILWWAFEKIYNIVREG